MPVIYLWVYLPVSICRICPSCYPEVDTYAGDTSPVGDIFGVSARPVDFYHRWGKFVRFPYLF